MRTLAALLLFALLTLVAPTLHAAEPWLKPNDVVALVGGEDMVALAEEGWLETLVTWAQPGDRIRFRSLAWEGDTVFEQRRDLNYPTLETQLDRMGATVVICQFGKMESFAGKEGVVAFTEAYEKLLARLSGENEWHLRLDGEFNQVARRNYGQRHLRLGGEFNPNGHTADSAYMTIFDQVFLTLGGYNRDGFSGKKKRRIALVMPMQFLQRPPGIEGADLPHLTPRNADLASYRESIRTLAGKHGGLALDAWSTMLESHRGSWATHDGIHLKTDWQLPAAALLFRGLQMKPEGSVPIADSGALDHMQPLRAAILAKNRLWFHYTRPQNWAFLAGNRTNQPSSRDHLDPAKRWFPEEMEQWLPLIEAKEREIQTLAAAPR